MLKLKKKCTNVILRYWILQLCLNLIDMRTGFRDERRLGLSSEIKVAEGLNNPWAFVVKKVTAMINIKDKLFSISMTCSLTKKTNAWAMCSFIRVSPSPEVVQYILTFHLLCSTFLYTAGIEERPSREAWFIASCCYCCCSIMSKPKAFLRNIKIPQSVVIVPNLLLVDNWCTY